MGIRTISTYDDLTPAEQTIVDTDTAAAMQGGMHPDQHIYDHKYVTQYPGGTFERLEAEARKDALTSFVIIPDMFHIMRESARRILQQQATEETEECEEELPVGQPLRVVA